MHGGKSNNQSLWLRRLILIAIWLSGFSIIFLTAWIRLPEVLVIPITLAIIIICWGASFSTQQRYTAQQITISNFEELQGRFVIYHPHWYILAILGMTGVIIATILVAEKGVQTISFAQWIGLLILAGVAIIGPLSNLSKQVFAFRIDENGMIWVRHWGRYYPLQLSQFREIRCITTRHKHNDFIPLHIVFSQGKGPIQQLVLSLGGIYSKTQRVPISAQLLNAFIYDACQKAGMHIEHVTRGQRRSWLATPQKKKLT